MIKIEKIEVSYQNNKIYDNFSLDLEDNKITCILGSSGCGKTTLLNVLAGIVPYKGNIINFPQTVSYIFQEERLLENLTVMQNLLYTAGKDKILQAEEILKKTEILDKKNDYPLRLSGGERQRVAIARAFLSDADVLLMDEPFSSLDTALKIKLTNVFTNLLKEGKKRTVVFVTHDVEEAMMLAHRIIVLEKGKIKDEIVPEGEIPRTYGKNTSAKKELLKVILN